MKVESVVGIESVVVEVEAYVQNHLARYIGELSDLCAVDSPSHYKPGLDQMAQYVYGRMRDLGMEARIVERETWGNDVVGVLRGTGEGNVLLVGHIDTVYPLGTAAARPMRVEGDVAYGPGVSDMKGCVLSALYALEALVAMNYRDFGEIRLVCVSDEEISERHSTDILEEGCRDCQRALVLEAARANGDIVSARKGFSWYTLTGLGHAAHAGVEPEKGCNAIIEVAHQVVQFQSLNGWREGTTINVGMVTGGIAPNVVPDLAEARIDVRYKSVEDRLALEERWQEMMGEQKTAGVKLSLEARTDFRQHPMVCTDESARLVSRARAIAGMLGFEVSDTHSGGCSDGNYTSGQGIATLDGLGPIGGLDHSPDEYLMLSSVGLRTALLAGLMIEH